MAQETRKPLDDERHAPSLMFVHSWRPNGLVISTCIFCGRYFGSPCRINLIMAECSPLLRMQSRMAVPVNHTQNSGRVLNSCN
jgi:hypothetical protein